MLSPTQIFELGKPRSGIAYVPVFETLSMFMGISTRYGNIVLNRGDGSADFNYTPLKNNDYTLSTNSTLLFSYANDFTGSFSIKTLNGNKDVYSLYLGIFHELNNNQSKFNINNLESFLAQFPNLYSFKIAEYSYGINSRRSLIKGDLAKVPDSVEKISLNTLDLIGGYDGTLFLNFSNYSNYSNLKSLISSNTGGFGSIKLMGDLSKLPSLCNLLDIRQAHSTSSISYTAGKIWASAFDTLFLPTPLTISENDSLFIDADNSVTTAIGGKSWTLKGYRSSMSDTSVSGLILKGFTVNCDIDKALILPLATNLLDSSTLSNNAIMVGTETHSLSGLVTSTGNYAYIPNKTNLDIGIGSIKFGCTVKFSAITGTKGIIGKLIFASAVGRYGIYIDSGNIVGINQITFGNIINQTALATYNDGNFHTIEVICNRKTGKQTLTIDGILINTQTFTPVNDVLSQNARFMIGGYGNPTGSGLQSGTEFNGIIKDVFVTHF